MIDQRIRKVQMPVLEAERAGGVDSLPGSVRDIRPGEAAVEKLEDGLRVLTTLDLVAANPAYHRRVPVSHSSITIAYLLAHILTARETLEAADCAPSE